MWVVLCRVEAGLFCINPYCLSPFHKAILFSDFVDRVKQGGRAEAGRARLGLANSCLRAGKVYFPHHANVD